MINALSCEPAIGHKPGDPLAASPASAIKMKNNAKLAPAPSAVATSLQVTAVGFFGGLGRDAYQGDRQQCAAHSTSCSPEGRSPARSPTTTGIAAEVTPVTGATTVMAPAERAR